MELTESIAARVVNLDHQCAGVDQNELVAGLLARTEGRRGWKDHKAGADTSGGAEAVLRIGNGDDTTEVVTAASNTTDPGGCTHGASISSTVTLGSMVGVVASGRESQNALQGAQVLERRRGLYECDH
jgi:hypothetical protein